MGPSTKRIPSGLPLDQTIHRIAPMKAFEDLIAVNRHYATTFSLEGLSSQPTEQVAIITCMDCRIHTAAALGLTPGKGHVLRNAGGRVTADMIRSLVASVYTLGVTQIAVIHHTQCGASAATSEVLRTLINDATGDDPIDMDFGLIDSEPDALIEDLEQLRASAVLPPGTHLAAFIYDVDTGLLNSVCAGEVGPEPLRVFD